MNDHQFDLVIIGSGPAGYVAAIRASQLGMKVACIDKRKSLGGTCLNIGCIPSKALLESSELYYQAKEKFAEHGISSGEVQLDFAKFLERKDKVVRQLTMGVAGLFKKNKITAYQGSAKVLSDNKVEIEIEAGTIVLQAKNILIATGSVPIQIPSLPFDGKNIIDSTQALSLEKIPQSLLIVGGGYIGLEMGSVYARLGTQVTVVEALDRILPGMDSEVSTAMERILKKQGFKFKLSTKVKSANISGNEVHVSVQNEKGEETLIAEKVLVAVGRKANTEGLGLSELGIKTDAQGRVEVDRSYRTNMSNLYAVGDVIAGPMLAHKASEEGVAAVEIMAGHTPKVNYQTIPGVVYTSPEAASVGITEDEAKKSGTPYKAFKFPLLANGRSLASGNKDGFVKLISSSENQKILGAHIIAPHASEMIAEIVIAMECGATAESIARTIHAHPTVSEATREAALGLTTGVIHM